MLAPIEANDETLEQDGRLREIINELSQRGSFTVPDSFARYLQAFASSRQMQIVPVVTYRKSYDRHSVLWRIGACSVYRYG